LKKNISGNKKTILITGINGMLGSTLYNLYKDNYEIIGIHRDNETYIDISNVYKADIRSLKDIKKDVLEFNPDIVIHCAGIINMEECEINHDLAYDINVRGTKNIIDFCSEDCLFIYISTDQVYGSRIQCSEDTRDLVQLNQYGRSKYLGELEVLKNTKNHIIIRTNIFGWNAKPNKISSAEWIYNELIGQNNITLFNDYWFSPIYTKYLGEIIENLILEKLYGIINIASPSRCSKYDFGLEMAKTLNISDEHIQKGSIDKFKFSALRNLDLSLNTKKITNLGIKIPDWKDSLYRFLKDKNLV